MGSKWGCLCKPIEEIKIVKEMLQSHIIFNRLHIHEAKVIKSEVRVRKFKRFCAKVSHLSSFLLLFLFSVGFMCPLCILHISSSYELLCCRVVCACFNVRQSLFHFISLSLFWTHYIIMSKTLTIVPIFFFKVLSIQVHPI